MKKILSILCAVSLLSVACTEDVFVSRDYDIDAEVQDMKTQMEMTTLYCNLVDWNPTVGEDGVSSADKFVEYVLANDVDVVTIIAPATIDDIKSDVRLQTIFADTDYTLWTAKNDNGKRYMAALVKKEFPVVKYAVVQGTTLRNAVLHIEANDIHFVVTELDAARNAIPEDWYDQVEAMRTAKKQSPLVYDPDNLATRAAEVSNIVAQTMDKAEFLGEKNWIWSVDTNAPSCVEVVKYRREFARVDCYDEVTDEFLGTSHAYFSVSEYLTSDDIYFGVNERLTYNGLIDSNAVQYSVFTPTHTDGSRENLLYASNDIWNTFQTLVTDSAAAAELGVAHYPIMVTLKREE